MLAELPIKSVLRSYGGDSAKQVNLMALAAPNVKNVIKEQFCSKNIWWFGTKTLPLRHH